MIACDMERGFIIFGLKEIMVTYNEARVWSERFDKQCLELLLLQCKPHNIYIALTEDCAHKIENHHIGIITSCHSINGQQSYCLRSGRHWGVVEEVTMRTLCETVRLFLRLGNFELDAVTSVYKCPD